MNKEIALYFFIAAIHLGALFFEVQNLQFYTKPLLMLSLLLYFWAQTGSIDSPIKKWVFVALSAALAGDTLLLFSGVPEKGILYFLAGLGSFLITQICYSFSFFKLRKFVPSGKNLIRAYLLPALFFVSILKVIWVFLPAHLQVPIVIYALAVAVMVSFAMQLKGSISDKIFLLISTGALLFMVSDSLIALDKFTPLLLTTWKPGFWVMLTYILAQAGIVSGLASAISESLDENQNKEI